MKGWKMKTRKENAQELMRLVSKGPDFTYATFGIHGADLTLEQRKLLQAAATADTRDWLETWVKPLVEELLKADLR